MFADLSPEAQEEFLQFNEITREDINEDIEVIAIFGSIHTQ